jgi:hypothetical protein
MRYQFLHLHWIPTGECLAHLAGGRWRLVTFHVAFIRNDHEKIESLFLLHVISKNSISCDFDII